MEDFNITSVDESYENENIIEEENLYFINDKIKNIECLELSIICNTTKKYFYDFFTLGVMIKNNRFEEFVFFNNTASKDNTITIDTKNELSTNKDLFEKEIISSYNIYVESILENKRNNKFISEEKFMILLSNDDNYLSDELDLTIVFKNKENGKKYEINITESFFDKKIIYLGELLFDNKLSYQFNNNVNGNLISYNLNEIPRMIKAEEIYKEKPNFINKRKIFNIKKPEEILKLERKVINFSF